MWDDYNPFDLRSQEEEEEKQKLKKKLVNKAEQEAFVWLMNDKRGRRFIWKLLERTGVFTSSFTGNSTTFFNEGQRNVGLFLMALINDYAPDQYIVAMKERKAELEQSRKQNFDRADQQ